MHARILPNIAPVWKVGFTAAQKLDDKSHHLKIILVEYHINDILKKVGFRNPQEYIEQ